MRFFAIALTFAAFLGGAVFTARQNAAPSAAAQESAGGADFSPEHLQKIREFSEVFRLVKDNYVEEISDEKLMENAIRGMIQGLDPHSAYFAAKDLESFQKSIRAEEYGGLGLYVGEKDGFIEIISPIDGTPAMRAGLRAGDLILKIDGTTTQDMGIDAAVELMRGKAGEIIILEVFSPGATRARKVELRREQITAPTATGAIAEADYGYLRVNRFQQETVDDLVKVINKLYAENGRPLRGMVLDLRNNPGGLLDSSIGVASIFLPEDAAVVSDRGRNGENSFTAHPRLHRGLKNKELIKTLPLAVLVNNGSASASEIVAGALQDHKRAVIIGRRTYGKASVQSLLRLPANNKIGVKLTTARYFTPLGRSIQAVGIKPDIDVAFIRQTAEAEEEEDDFTFSEKDLPRHLENLQQEESSETGAAETESAPFLPRNDNQYAQALVVVKALAVTGN